MSAWQELQLKFIAGLGVASGLDKLIGVAGLGRTSRVGIGAGGEVGLGETCIGVIRIWFKLEDAWDLNI